MSSAVGSIREEVSFTKQSFKKLCENGRLCEALQDVDRMDQQGVRIPTSFFYHLLQGCVIKKDLAVGREVHRLIRQSGLQSTSFLGNHLIRMYDSCGSFSEANQAFSDLTEPDVFVWTSLLSVNAKLGQFEQVFKWYQQMHHSNIKPDGHAFVAVLKACVSKAAFREGQLIHAHIKESDFESNVFVGSTLIDMYAKCGSLEDAYAVFAAMPNRNVITWSTIIMGYAQHGLFWEALQLYKQMQVEGMMPDQVTCMGIIKACASLGTFAHGKLIHLQIVESNFWSDVCVINILIDMYAKCGDLKHSCKVFEQSPTRDVVTWSAMIAGYIQHGHDQEALQLFERMQFLGVQVDRVTLLSSLKACSRVSSLYQGNLIHALVIESGLEFDVSIGNTLIDVYVNCESLEDACRVFDRMSKRDTVTWTVMIAGYSQLGQGSDAIFLFNQVRQGGVRPDRVIFVSILKTCSSIAALRDGKLIHVESIENGFEADIGLSNTLIDMYSNCRSLEDACRVFSRMPKRDVVTWNAMIAGCFECNSHKLAWQYYEGMQQGGLKPDRVTFVNLLSACSHRGLVSKGYDLLKSMKEDHGIEPTVDHCNCMADLLGRIGRVNEAEDALKTVKLGFNIVGWTSLLSHCKTHGNVEVGERCFEHVVTLDPKNSKGYTLMSNIYVNAGRLEDAEMIEQLRHCANAWKKPGNALVEVDNNVHEFFVGDDAHPQIHDVGKKLKNLSVQMQQKGYMPCLDLTLSLLLDDDRQGALKWAE